ncbi:DNA cytosine methyltransferase [Salinibaculum rarum]|uniref:DNA cytosine methyltransferase n=1 Tax=Salinibaculum rarum TaxID=3058903 RepID=UPI00265E3BBD|nr:DNA cytosine methyltransferase [Salinibaculum sp. KK48]
MACWDCITVYSGTDAVTALFEQIADSLNWADRWKWESATFEDKFRYAMRVKRLEVRTTGNPIVSDPRRPKLPDTAPPKEAAYQTALEYTLAEPSNQLKERQERPIAVDLFSGAGGAALGMLDAGFAVVGVEHDANARLAHTVNLDECRRVDLADTSQSLRVPQPTWVHASPPCKGFSRAGLQKADDERNELTWKTIEWVADLEPRIVTMEQVPGFKDGGHTARLRQEFDDIGYDVAITEVNAADYGVPQTRERLIVVAVRADAAGSPSLPDPTHAPTAQETLFGETLSAYRTVGDVLPVQTDRAKERNHSPPSHTEAVEARFKRLSPGQNVTELDNAGTKKASQRRLDPNAPAPTITGVPSDYVHPTMNRCLTNRELARLQTFPDWFRFTGPKKGGGGTRGEITTQAEQIGNAVPPQLMKIIGEHISSEFC